MFPLLALLGCGDDAPPTDAGACAQGPQAPVPRQLRLLTRREYDHTVADLLPQLVGGAACASDAGCAIDLESCVGGTCQADPCELVTFLLPSDGHEGSVSVAGSFNGWDAAAWPLAYVPEHGAWVGKRVVADGTHQYKFVVDGTWVADPGNAASVDDGYGGVNSVLVQACADAPAMGSASPGSGLPPESPPPGYPFDAAAETGLVTTVHAELYAEAARDLAAGAVADLPGLLGCAAPSASCVEPWVRSFGRRAFRRPLSDEEVDRYVALAGSFPDLSVGVSAALQAFLQSPSFLYRSEIGVGVAGTYLLDGPEIASAMSYLLWGSMPDEELLAAGESGALGDPDVRGAQVERMLADPRAAATIASFATQWLDVADVPTLIRNDPTFDAALGAAMVDESARFVSSTVLDGGAYADLLLAPPGDVDPALAALYASGERVGILGQASVLTATSHSDQTSPIRRGLFVRERLLCEAMPAPPPNVGVVPTVSEDATTRERFAQHTADPFCASCHERIDPIGFGLEGFDPIGRARSEENGLPIDTSGAVVDLDGADPAFVGEPALAALLAGSPSARDCWATQWWRWSAGRLETPAQSAELCDLHRAFAESGGDLRALFVALVREPNFVRRSP